MKTINKLLIGIFLFGVYSCEDILEEDITDEIITIISPLNGQEIESNVVTFSWNSIKGADDYRIQVYSNQNGIILDSLVSKTNFTFPLNQGMYQWHVRGENFAYQSPYTFPVNFTMIEATDLTNQQVLLGSPEAGIYINNPNLVFSWSALSVAESYTFELINVTNGNTILYNQSDITSTTLSLPSNSITQDAYYQWKVKAINTESETQFSSRTFYVDTAVPNLPQNISPVNNAEININQNINFEWSIPSDTNPISAPVSYTIQISTDQSFVNIIQTDNTSVNNYQYTFTNTGNYYWRVKAFDQAQNQGAYNTGFKLVVE